MSTGVALLILWVSGVICEGVFAYLCREPGSAIAYTIYTLAILLGTTYVLYLIHAFNAIVIAFNVVFASSHLYSRISS